MIDIQVEQGKLGKLVLKGNLSCIMTDLTSIVGYVYGFIDKRNHDGGEQFKNLFAQSFGEKPFREMMWSLGKLSTALTAADEEEEAEAKLEIRNKDEFLRQMKKILSESEDDDDEN